MFFAEQHRRDCADALRYQRAYLDVIAAIVKAARGDDLMARPGISIKLSALNPRYELAKHRRLAAELLPRVLVLLVQVREGRITVTIDAEESERLEPSLDLFARLAAAPELAGWDGPADPASPLAAFPKFVHLLGDQGTA